MRFPDELKEQLLEPAKEVIEYMESRLHLLDWQERKTLEELRFGIKMFELEKQYKMKRGF